MSEIETTTENVAEDVDQNTDVRQLDAGHTQAAAEDTDMDGEDQDSDAGDGDHDDGDGDGDHDDGDGDGDGGEEDQDDGAGDGSNREAAKYRRRLRDAEAERDQLAERVESLQRAEIERLATADSLRPAALWSSGVELTDLLDDDGTVSAVRVAEAIGAAREQLGIPAPPVGPRVPKEGRSLGRPSRPSGKSAMVAAVMGGHDD